MINQVVLYPNSIFSHGISRVFFLSAETASAIFPSLCSFSPWLVSPLSSDPLPLAAATVAAHVKDLALDAEAAAAHRTQAVVTVAQRRLQLQEDVTRYELALADACRRLQEAATATGGIVVNNTDAPPTFTDDDDVTPATGDVDVVAALHAQALGILNVRALVPVVLDLAAPSFSKWRCLMLLALGKYALAGDDAFPAVPHCHTGC